MSVVACRIGSPQAAPRAPVTLSIGLPFPANRSDPTVGIRQLVSLISDEGLVATSPAGRHEPGLAARWEQLDAGRTLRLHLQPQAMFEDGSPLTAPVVKASLDASRADPSAQFQHPMLQAITAVDVIGPHVLEIVSTQASTLLLDDLEVPIRKHLPDGRTLTPGPYALTSEGTDDVAVLRVNPHYRGERPAIDVIRIQAYPSVRTAWAALMRGEIDFLYRVPSDARVFVEGESSARVFSFLRPYAYTLVFNTNRAPLRAPAVRRALNLAVDRQAIIDRALGGHGAVANGHISPLNWTYDGDAMRFGQDPQQADELLSGQGLTWPGTDTASAEADTMPARLRFTCLVATEYWPYEEIAILLQKQLYDIGVDMQLEAVSIEMLLRRLEAGTYDSVLLDLVGGPGLARAYAFWHSGGTARPWRFGYGGADAALDAIRTATDPPAIRTAARRFQRALIEDPPAIFLAWPETARAVSRRFDIPETDRDIVSTIGRWRLAGETGTAEP